MRLVIATDTHWQSLFGTTPPDGWFGRTLLDGEGRIAAMGVVWFAIDGRWWAGFRLEAPEALPRVAIHRAALDGLAFSREQGLALHALCDETRPRAREWLERLGFRMTDERLPGGVVWRTR